MEISSPTLSSETWPRGRFLVQLTKACGTLAEISQLFILYTVDLDVKMAKKRVQFEDQNTTASGKLLVSKHVCSELQLYPLVRVGRTQQKEGLRGWEF